MPTPYKNAIGKRLPSVTTITGRFKDSSALMIWANREGLEGRGLHEKSDEATTIGTVVHKMAQQYAQGANEDACRLYAHMSLPEADHLRQANNGFDAFLKWLDGHKIEIAETEVRMVSEVLQVGGTLDAIGIENGRRVLIDYKNAGGIYPENLVQIAAYKGIWEELFPDRPITGGFRLVRFSKEWGDFSHHQYDELDDAWEQFKDYKRCYERDKLLKKRAH